MLSHFFNNALILTLTKFGVESFMMPVMSLILITSPICLIASLIWLFAFDKKKDGEKEQAVALDKIERKRFFVYAWVGLAICVFMWGAVFVSGL